MSPKSPPLKQKFSNKDPFTLKMQTQLTTPSNKISGRAIGSESIRSFTAKQDSETPLSLQVVDGPLMSMPGGMMITTDAENDEEQPVKSNKFIILGSQNIPGSPKHKDLSKTTDEKSLESEPSYPFQHPRTLIPNLQPIKISDREQPKSPIDELEEIKNFMPRVAATPINDSQR